MMAREAEHTRMERGMCVHKVGLKWGIFLDLYYCTCFYMKLFGMVVEKYRCQGRNGEVSVNTFFSDIEWEDTT